MTRTILATALFGWCATFFVGTVAHAGDGPASTMHTALEEFSAQRQTPYRAPRRVRVYRQSLGPNAVRVCNAYYVQEYRASGTVIVPRMNCYWRG